MEHEPTVHTLARNLSRVVNMKFTEYSDFELYVAVRIYLRRFEQYLGRAKVLYLERKYGDLFHAEIWNRSRWWEC